MMKILVVEDERLLADSLQTLLTGRGFSVDTANDGLTGLEYAKTDVYDLVILDVMMPGLDGYTVASRLRAEHHAVPILMLTAKSDLMDRVAGLNAGADYYLTKPFDSRELLACVGALLRRQGEQVDELTFGNTALDLSAGMLRCGTPILMLTARSELEDRIEGLNAGADYYLTKPFDIRELLACINALLRRQGPQVDQVTLGNTALDLGACTLICGEKRVQLSAREFDVMRILLRSQSTILSKEVILARVWGYDSDAVENHVEVYAGFLRKKLASIGSNVRIEAIRRLGYHLEVAEV